jgi:hypothetical protein
MYVPYFIYPFHLLVDFLGCTHLLAILNNASMNMVVQISPQVSAFTSEIAELYDTSFFK